MLSQFVYYVALIVDLKPGEFNQSIVTEQTLKRLPENAH